MAAPSRLPGPDRCWADRPSPEDSGRGRIGSGSRPGGTPCSPGQPRTGTARPHRKSAPPVPRGRLATARSRVLPACGSSQSFQPLSQILQDLQNLTIILDDYSTTQSFVVSILPPDREHTSLLGPRKLDFSSREISL